jgi:hypothetical protein
MKAGVRGGFDVLVSKMAIWNWFATLSSAELQLLCSWDMSPHGQQLKLIPFPTGPGRSASYAQKMYLVDHLTAAGNHYYTEVGSIQGVDRSANRVGSVIENCLARREAGRHEGLITPEDFYLGEMVELIELYRGDEDLKELITVLVASWGGDVEELATCVCQLG